MRSRPGARGHLSSVALACVVLLFGCTELEGDESVGASEGADGGAGRSGACPVGSERCPCTSGGSCDEGLRCLSNVCVCDAADCGDEPAGSAGDGDSGGSAAGDGDGDSAGDGNGDLTGDGDAGGEGDVCGDAMASSTEACDDGNEVTGTVIDRVPPSCAGAGLDCVERGTAVSCCEAKVLPRSTFPMGRCGAAGAGCSDAYDGDSDELPEHDVTVSSFALDTFEVTVGRFRSFVSAYGMGWRPSPGDGEQPHNAGTGWDAAWDVDLPANATALRGNLACDASSQTWTDTRGSGEQHPINCVSWYEAFAFCAWDEGWLPTEAEWEYAAAGGVDNRLYPWGAQDPAGDPLRANFVDTASSPSTAVGSYPAGMSRWGQHDLAGSLVEWTLDWHDGGWYGGAGSSCSDCTNDTPASGRVIRGGGSKNNADSLRAAYRGGGEPGFHYGHVGFRCARSSM